MNKFILLLILSLVTCDDEEQVIYRHFQRFVKKYGKKYSSTEEYLTRYNAFKGNYLTILENGPQEYDVGITKYSDMTPEEFKKTYLNFNPNYLPKFEIVTPKETDDAVPDEFDWRDKGVVADVKDQGQCGSCWSFATMANLEGLYAQEKGVIKTFSEQFLVDCDTQDYGCDGGIMQNSFDWLKKNGGFMYEKDYPYTAQKGTTCKSDPSKYVDMKVTGYEKLGLTIGNFLFPCDEGEMKEFLYQTGPLAIGLDATPLQLYIGGIVDVDNCSSGINHAVTLVGYGTGTKDYWIVKNSWGKDWGENGYFRIARGKGTCLVNYYVTTATVEF